jgi:hypothetical protein
MWRTSRLRLGWTELLTIHPEPRLLLCQRAPITFDVTDQIGRYSSYLQTYEEQCSEQSEADGADLGILHKRLLHDQEHNCENVRPGASGIIVMQVTRSAWTCFVFRASSTQVSMVMTRQNQHLAGKIRVWAVSRFLQLSSQSPAAVV